jgi:hypothetical protein
MLPVASALRKDSIAVTDGRIGTVSDVLFDDWTRNVRWLLADAGTWLTGRDVLIHPSGIGPVECDLNEPPVALAKPLVKDSPEIATGQPVSRQTDSNLGGHYGQDTDPDGGACLGGHTATMGPPFVSPPVFAPEPGAYDYPPDETADPHPRGLTAISEHKMIATDGPIGHVEEVRIDDRAWAIRYLMVDTRDWRPGENILISDYAVSRASWGDGDIAVRLTRKQVKWWPTAPPASSAARVASCRRPSRWKTARPCWRSAATRKPPSASPAAARPSCRSTSATSTALTPSASPPTPFAGC